MVSVIEYKGAVRRFDASDWKQFKSAGPEEKRRTFMTAIRDNAIYLAELLIEKRWSVVFANEPVFITTDAPVQLIHPDNDRVGFKTPGVVVCFPLSPTRVLIMDDRHDQPKGQYYPLSETGPGPVNLTAWRNCERFMISSRQPDEVCVEMLNCAEQENQQRPV